jgi:NADH-quinone oxidoreductase subunit J
MMLDLVAPEQMKGLKLRDWWPALALAAMTLAALIALIMGRSPLSPGGGGIGAREFSLVLFQKYGIAVEITSMQLLFALVGALYLGRRK